MLGLCVTQKRFLQQLLDEGCWNRAQSSFARRAVHTLTCVTAYVGYARDSAHESVDFRLSTFVCRQTRHLWVNIPAQWRSGASKAACAHVGLHALAQCARRLWTGAALSYGADSEAGSGEEDQSSVPFGLSAHQMGLQHGEYSDSDSD